MLHFKRYFFSLPAVAIFVVIVALNSCILPNSSFRIGSYGFIEDTTDTKNYLLRNEGTKIYGNEIKVNWNINIGESHISIDDQKFNTKEIKGYQENRTFYYRFQTASKKDYMKRIIHGKINVYERQLMGAAGTGSSSYTYQSYSYFMQRGDDGKLEPVKNGEDVRKAVSDCPKAAEKLNMTTKELNKKVKASSYFLSEVIRAYNECQ